MSLAQRTFHSNPNPECRVTKIESRVQNLVCRAPSPESREPNLEYTAHA